MQFKLAAFVAGGRLYILPCKITGRCPVEGIKDVRDRYLERSISLKEAFLQACVEAPHRPARQGRLPDIGRHIILCELTCPASTEAEIMLGINGGIKDIQIDDPPCAEVGFVQGVKAGDVE